MDGWMDATQYDTYLEELSCLLYVLDVSVGIDLHGGKTRQVALRVHVGLAGDAVAEAVELHAQNGPAPFAHRSQVCRGGGGCAGHVAAVRSGCLHAYRHQVQWSPIGLWGAPPVPDLWDSRVRRRRFLPLGCLPVVVAATL